MTQLRAADARIPQSCVKHFLRRKDMVRNLSAMVIVCLPFTLQAGEGKMKSPTLPLPVVTAENSQIPTWPEGRLMANSMRAWHYNPDLVMPMIRVGEAVQNSILDYGLQMKIAAVVSARNGCMYCICSSARALNADGTRDTLMQQLQRPIKESSLATKEKAALILAEGITQDPSLSGLLVEQALEAGWNNQEVAQIIFFSAYMNMMNRIAEGFNLPPDEYHPYDPETNLPMLRCGQQ